MFYTFINVGISYWGGNMCKSRANLFYSSYFKLEISISQIEILIKVGKVCKYLWQFYKVNLYSRVLSGVGHFTVVFTRQRPAKGLLSRKLN